MKDLRTVINSKKNTYQMPAHIYGGAKSVKAEKKIKGMRIKIALGDMVWRGSNFGPYDFWITNNTYFPLPWNMKHLEMINKSGAITFINSSCVRGVSSKEKLENVFKSIKSIELTSKIYFYDSSHKNMSKCLPENKCCLFVDEFKIYSGLQQELKKYVNYKSEVYECDHSLFHAVALAILLNCNPIYISGIEFPEFMKDYKHYKNWKQILGLKLRILVFIQQYLPLIRNKKTDFSGNFRLEILRDLEAIGDLAKKLGIEIYTTSNKGLLRNLSGFASFYK
jgi:hypothetical protein